MIFLQPLTGSKSRLPSKLEKGDRRKSAVFYLEKSVDNSEYSMKRGLRLTFLRDLMGK